MRRSIVLLAKRSRGRWRALHDLCQPYRSWENGLRPHLSIFPCRQAASLVEEKRNDGPNQLLLHTAYAGCLLAPLKLNYSDSRDPCDSHSQRRKRTDKADHVPSWKYPAWCIRASSQRRYKSFFRGERQAPLIIACFCLCANGRICCVRVWQVHWYLAHAAWWSHMFKHKSAQNLHCGSRGPR